MTELNTNNQSVTAHGGNAETFFNSEYETLTAVVIFQQPCHML